MPRSASSAPSPVAWNVPLPGLSITGSPAQRREVVDDVVAVLAADQDAALGPGVADPQRRVAAAELGRRAVGQVGDVPLARVDTVSPTARAAARTF